MVTSDVEVVSVRSTLTYLFAADSAIAQQPFRPATVEQLMRAFGAEEFLVQPGDQPLWQFRQASIKFSDSRTVLVSSITGSAIELAVAVEGSSGDAGDVLDEVWTHLVEAAGSEPSRITDAAGSVTPLTAATVRLPKRASSLLPALGRAAGFFEEKLGSSWLRPPGTLPFRLVVPLNIAVRGLRVERAFVIEPRKSSVEEDQTYYTASPLRSEDHLALLQHMIASE